MPEAHRWLVWLHAAAGSVALASMWVPIFAKKGGRAHRRGGLVYVYAMAVATVTSLAAIGWRMAVQPAQREASLFLALVALLAGASTILGVRVLRQKRRGSAHRGLLEWATALALGIAGVAAIGYWLAGAGVLFVIFGALCALLSFGRVRALARAPTSGWFWWYEHLANMLVACIGTLTAFLVVNYANAPDAVRAAVPAVAVWVAPGIVGAVVITLWTRHYRRELEPG